MMSSAFQAISQTNAEDGSDQSLRDAAYQIAIKRIAASYQAIGIQARKVAESPAVTTVKSESGSKTPQTRNSRVDRRLILSPHSSNHGSIHTGDIQVRSIPRALDESSKAEPSKALDINQPVITVTSSLAEPTKFR